jgi:hypothetical protein
MIDDIIIYSSYEFSNNILYYKKDIVVKFRINLIKIFNFDKKFILK